MPASDLHDPEDRTAAGVKVKYLYCPECALYSGGRLCRVCQRGFGEFTPPMAPGGHPTNCGDVAEPGKAQPEGAEYAGSNPAVAANPTLL